MKILVVTNRNLENPGASNETLFGEGVNQLGPSELRLAWAEQDGDGWNVKLIDEPPRGTMSETNLPSRDAFPPRGVCAYFHTTQATYHHASLGRISQE